MKTKKKHIFPAMIFLLMAASGFSQEQIRGSMESYYASPMVEDASRNIILQNRCGNRLTMLFREEATDLQFIYKPNAYRRKDFRARNFSNRDNYTELFKSCTLPGLAESYISGWNYDPFLTVLEAKTPWEARNEIKILNIADENAFAICAKSPLLLVFKPHGQFTVRDGLLTEKFTDRGEDILSFIHFSGMEENRFRVTAGGEYLIQIFRNEVIIIGGEENTSQINRLLAGIGDMEMDELIARNEKILAPKMNKGLMYFNDPDFQKVMDINHRIAWSGIDEGGACFGALNRIYYLIWVRDGSMTSSQMARSGNPELVKIWTPFLLDNPTVTRKENGETVKEFLQMVGTPWTKAEDDGIFYATLSLFTYFQTTGQNDLIESDAFPVLLTAIDNFLEKAWDNQKKMIISDTRGETPLKDNPYFGYDVVNGDYERNNHHKSGSGKSISASASLYNQVNTFNLLKMAVVLLEQRPGEDRGRTENYSNLARQIQSTIVEKYKSASGYLYSEYLLYDDGTEGWQEFAPGADYWEYAWAVSLGPFYPAPDLQLTSARMVPSAWPKIRTYGYCPWNTLSGILYEYGMPSGEYKKMLSDEVNEALYLSRKYPMAGALTEYNTAVESWRALPFSAGSFFFSLAGQCIQSLPQGIAVRASQNMDSVNNYCFRLSSLDVRAQGKGDVVDSWKMNGMEMEYSLQIPESLLRSGRNRVEIERTPDCSKFRLYSSTAILRDMDVRGSSIVYTFHNGTDTELVLENPGKADISFTDLKGNRLEYKSEQLAKSNKVIYSLKNPADFLLIAGLKSTQ